MEQGPRATRGKRVFLKEPQILLEKQGEQNRSEDVQDSSEARKEK